MEVVAIYITKTIQEYLPASFLARAGKRQPHLLYKIFLASGYKNKMVDFYIEIGSKIFQSNLNPL